MAYLGLILTAALLGSMLLFVALVAPTVFQVLDPEPAGKFLRALFPRLYTWITILGLTTGIVLSWSSTLGALLLFAVAAGAAYSNWTLTPQINLARDRSKAGDHTAKARFDKLHGRSTRIYGVQLIVLIGVLILLAF